MCLKLVNLLRTTIALTLIVMMLGAYTRLTDAGLGCPDWPGCYGKLIAPTDLKSEAYTKAWTEMAHRYLAGILGLFVFIISAIGLKKSKLLPCLLSSLIIFQACLGMWTVSLKLYPIVVMGHLLGGFTLISLLFLYLLQVQAAPKPNPTAGYPILTIAGLLCLLLQIMLGGWTSANYAALVCLDFPFCNGTLLPEFNFVTAFDFLNAGILDSPGNHLDYTARVSIQMMHRFGAFVVFVILGLLSLLTRNKMLGLLLIMQISLGIINVLAMLPVSIAVLHNGIAACLLLALIQYGYTLWHPSKPFKIT